MLASAPLLPKFVSNGAEMDYELRKRAPASAGRVEGGLLVPPALHRGRDSHGLAVLCNRAARDVDAGRAQLLDDRVVREHLGRAFAVDQLPDPMAHRFRRMRLAPVR